MFTMPKCRSMLLDYNVYLPEDDSDVEENPSTSEQLYSTRLYILLMIGFILIIGLLLLFIPQTLVVTIDNPSLATYKQLYNQYSSTLNCPCSTINIRYESFISIEYSLHPLCHFIDDEWIMSFYFPNSSHFGPTDYRTLASTQFQLIRQLCRLADETIKETIQIDIEKAYLISSKLLIEDEVLATVNATVDFTRSNSALVFLRTLSIIRFIIKNNNLVSILRTNFDFNSYGGFFSMGTVNSNGQMICQCLFSGCDVITDIGFSNWTGETDFSEQLIYYPWWYNSGNRVDGLVGSCTVLDGLLMSNLTCFYEDTCLNLLLSYFPHLTREMLWNGSAKLSQIKDIQSISELIEQLFIINWLTTINHTEYFQQCSPKSCSYAYENNRNILYAFTKLLSIYGGLTVAVYFITPYIIKIFMHKNRPRTNQSRNLRDTLKKIKLLLVNLNLFKTEDRSPNTIHEQRWATRIYLLVLSNCLIIVLIILATRKHTNIIRVPSPSFDTYQSLSAKTNDLSCFCSQMNTDYGSFISFAPSFHQICSSIFVEENWIDWITTSIQYVNPYVFDWRYLAEKYTISLKILCQLSNSTVVSAIEQFQKRTYVNSHLFEQSHFETSWQIIIDDFIRSTELSFSQIIQISSSFLQVDQPAAQGGTNGRMIMNGYHPFFSFDYPSTPVMIATSYCALDVQCQVSASIFTGASDAEIHAFPIPEAVYNVSGFVIACFPTESLFRSHFDCFYSNNIECFSNLINAISINNTLPPNFDNQPLNSSLPTRFSQTDLISTIVYKLMLEQWSSKISYENYFHQCSPSQCIYSKVEHTSLIEILTTIISLYGGLSIALRLFIPYVIKIFFKKLPQPYIPVRTRIRNIITNLNIFPLQSFGTIIDRDRAKRLGRWTTRLYIILFSSSIIIFALYALIRPEIVTDTINNPSINDYQQFLKHSSKEIDCACSTVSVLYESFLQIEPSFHQICSSDFVSYEWQQSLLRRIPINSYSVNDYRRFISAHLQFLGYLCQISLEQVNNSIQSFAKSYFVSAQLLSETVFETRISENIRMTQLNIFTSLIRQLMLLREIMHGNKIVSFYASNYRYIYWPEVDITLAQPVIYDDGCSCEFHRNCTSSTIFKGLRMGCVPTEALFSSTLECFYDEQCLQLLKNRTLNSVNKNVTMKTLNSSLTSRYSWNTTTVNDLIQELFIETWSISTNFSSYFQQCSPSQCTRTHIRQADIFNSITLLIGLSGSLTIILKWFCPLLIQIFFKIIHNRVTPAN